jgi:hypothetical protein
MHPTAFHELVISCLADLLPLLQIRPSRDRTLAPRSVPVGECPRCLQRDRDSIFGDDFVQQVKAIAIEQVLSAPRSPWQRTRRTRDRQHSRECLDHVIVFDERSLHYQLLTFCSYCDQTQTHSRRTRQNPG